MIERILKVDNFGVFDSFEWNKVTGLPDFNDKNIVYGWNYSGKTTLSRIFKSLKDRKVHEDFDKATFKIKTDKGEIGSDRLNEFPYEVEVFNAEYVRENLRWEYDESINAISFEVGENAKVKQQIVSLSDRIKAINGDEVLIGEKSIHRELVNELNAFEDKFSKEAKRIKNDAFSSLIEFRKDHLKKAVTAVIGDINQYIITDETELARLAVAVKIDRPNDEIPKINFDGSYEKILNATKDLLKREPIKEELIESLEDISSFYWAKQGLQLHRDIGKCKFCDNTLDERRVEKLVNYFSNEVAVLRENIQDILKWIEDEVESVNHINAPLSVNDFNEGYKQNYEQHKRHFDNEKGAYLDALIVVKEDLLLKQEKFLFKSIESEAPASADKNFYSAIEAVNKIIEANNLFVLNFDEELESEREKYKKHLVSLYLKTEDFISINTKAEKAQVAINALDDEVAETIKKITSLEAEINKVSLGCEELNSFIKSFLNREDITIVVNKETNSFNLKRGQILAKNLSEGEKSAIAFSYFLVYLESLCKSGKLLDKIIFIDDPISSLDTNHIAKIYSIINTFFFRQGFDQNEPNKVINCFKQLFISTHNFEFFSFLKDSNRLKKKKKVIREEKSIEVPSVEYYFIRKVTVNTSTITPLPQALKKYKSEYILLFSHIFDFYSRGCSIDDEYFILMPNAIRRFLEVYTLMKLPHIADELDNRLNELVGDAMQIKFLHHFSHFTSFEKILKYDDLIAILPDATTELINLLEKDLSHYTSLKRAIGVK